MDRYITFCWFEDAVSSTVVSGTKRPTPLEDYLLREYLQNMEVSVSDDATTEIQSDGSRPSTASSSETDADTFAVISHSHGLEFVEFLLRKGHTLLMRNLDGKERICSVLLAMAENVQVLKPANEPLASDILSMSQWQDSLRELINGMKTVEELENFQASLIGNGGVYVLTTSPYPEFLRALAAEIADRHC